MLVMATTDGECFSIRSTASSTSREWVAATMSDEGHIDRDRPGSSLDRASGGDHVVDELGRSTYAVSDETADLYSPAISTLLQDHRHRGQGPTRLRRSAPASWRRCRE